MPADILLPLATFCSQSIAQRYIKTIRNRGDAWHTLAEQSSLPEHRDSALRTFGLNLTIRKNFNGREDFSAKLDIPSFEPVSEDVQCTHDTTSSSPRHFHIFPDYGTDFIWLNDNDPTYNGESSHIEFEDALSGLPKEVFDNYDAWVETYTTNFKERCDKSGDYTAYVFPAVAEEVAWNVAGFLLAWRIALASHVGSIKFGVGREKYVLKKREGVGNVIYSFLEDQARFLKKGETLQ